MNVLQRGQEEKRSDGVRKGEEHIQSQPVSHHAGVSHDATAQQSSRFHTSIPETFRLKDQAVPSIMSLDERVVISGYADNPALETQLLSDLASF